MIIFLPNVLFPPHSQVSGAAPPKPCTSFAHFSFDEQLMHQIRKSEYTQPTPIQCQVYYKASLMLQDNWIINMSDFMKNRSCSSPSDVVGRAHSTFGAGHDRYCQNWQWQNGSFHLAHAGSHHGPEGVGGWRGAHSCHCVPHQRALSAGRKRRWLGSDLVKV